MLSFSSYLSLLSFIYSPLMVSATSGGLMVQPPVGCLKFPELSEVCGGHGRCVDVVTGLEVREANVPGSTCICDYGWTGHADSVDLTSHSCTVLTLWDKIWWIISTIAAFGFLCVLVYKLIQSVLHLQNLIQEHVKPVGSRKTLSYKNQNQNQSSPTPTTHTKEFFPGRDKQLSSLDNGPSSPKHLPAATGDTDEVLSPLAPSTPPSVHKPKHLHLTPSRLDMVSELLSWEIVNLSLLTIPPCLALLICGVLRSLPEGDEEYLVGRSYLTTILSGVCTQGATALQKRTVLHWLTIRGKVGRFTESDFEKIEQAVERLRRCCYVAVVLDVALFFVLLFVPAYPGYANLIMCLHHTVNGVGIFIQGCFIVYVGKKLENIVGHGLDRLKGSVKTERDRALQNIRSVIRWGKQTLSVPFTMMLMAFWPLVRMHVTYLFGVAYLGAIYGMSLKIRNCQLPSQFQSPDLWVKAFGDLSTHLGNNDMSKSSRDVGTLPRGSRGGGVGGLGVSGVRGGGSGGGRKSEMELVSKEENKSAALPELSPYLSSSSTPFFDSPTAFVDSPSGHPPEFSLRTGSDVTGVGVEVREDGRQSSPDQADSKEDDFQDWRIQ